MRQARSAVQPTWCICGHRITMHNVKGCLGQRYANVRDKAPGPSGHYKCKCEKFTLPK